MTDPKPYQIATVKAACEVLMARSGRPRFLVADEVGLGKTVVAQHVIRTMARGKRRPLVVYYVCSNLTIAAQNRRKLVEAVAPGAEADTAICAADRLSMLPFQPRPSHERVHLYTLTPDTSLPGRKGKRRDGRKEERALIYLLVERCWPGLLKPRMFRRNATRHWGETLRRARDTLQASKGRHGIGLGQLKRLFREKVREQLGLEPGAHVPSAIRQFDRHKDALEIISKFRSALVECVFDLEGLQPDLVIFDEFQRFRELAQPTVSLDGSKAQALDHIAQRLRGDKGGRTPLLLLSATPYSLYSRRDEQALFGNHHDQLLDLICFLFGDGEEGRQQAERAKRLFIRFASLLRSPQLDFEAIEKTKTEIERHLTRVMSRTERAQIEKAFQADASASKESPCPVAVETEAQDWEVFRHLSNRLPGRYRGVAVTYWRSIPLAMQTMGTGYIVWRHANAQNDTRRSRTPSFALGDWQKHTKVLWPHPKLRKLVSAVAPDVLCLPWVPPSLPWWPLDKRWQVSPEQMGKLLMFSRFRATPKIVAAAVSHEARAWAARTGRLTSSSSSLPLKTERMPVFALFYPALWLADACEPLQAAGRRPGDVHRAVQHQLAEYLKAHGITIKRSSNGREFWRLLAALDDALSDGRKAPLARVHIPKEVTTLWRKAAGLPVTSISQAELRELAWHALGAPGVVMARSLRRHFPIECLEEEYPRLLEFCLHPWRNYFDNRIFVASLRERKGIYTHALQQAVFHGNLEAVLDEHLWYVTQGGVSSLRDILRQLDAAVGISGGRVNIHSPHSDETWFRSQCDVALPLAQELEPSSPDDKEKPLRADQIRTAFNSPFWPFVLTTTSIGQEGLDFHPWCKTLLHWDLPGNPVDLEQREGRIKRFAGLAVRQAMARDKGGEALAATDMLGSPWRSVQTLVDGAQYSDDSGLQPWWHYKDASVDTQFFHMPASDEIYQLEQLKQHRAIYRLALGQQNQEDFVRIVITRDRAELERLAELTPNLSAWARRQRR